MMSNKLSLVVQLASVVLCPLVPGTIQTVKARLQGRRGASPLQPWRELRRLWRKSVVAPHDTTFVYRLAPSVAAASIACALMVVPIGSTSIGWFGSDAIVLVGLLALARFAITAAAWDPGNGFSLMAAGRDLMFSVFAEPLLLLAITLVALSAGSTDLVSMIASARDVSVASTPAHWCAALAFVLIVLVETGRQPIDNPDTHLELTMVHEGPLLEYAGRDLAYLQWAAAARHWVVIVLTVQLFVPLPKSAPMLVAALAVAILAACVLLAIIESSVAKMRIMRVPALLGAGTAVCLAGLASWIAGGGA